MPKSIRLLLYLCIAAIAGLLCVQFYWIKNYYAVTEINFERDVNLAFEDAIKKEFSLRNDTIEGLLVQQLMDTSAFTITSDTRIIDKQVELIITDARSKKQITGFSYKDLNRGLAGNSDSVYKRKIAQHFAHGIREEDFENHMVYYRTQDLGKFEVGQVEKYGFDTARLRPVLAHYLANRNIYVPFQFYLRQQDSTLNTSRFPDSISYRFPVITKSFPTYKLTNNTEQYVRAMFGNPARYILSQMGWLFASSIALIMLVALCIYLLLKTLYREKRLSAIKNDFIDNITHEFKTPIATVSAAVEAMSDFGVLQDERKAARYLQHSRNELERLNRLVNKVLNLSIYEQGQFEVHNEIIEVEKEIRQVMESLTLSSKKVVTFNFINQSSHQCIWADKVHFHQVVSNVLDNAIKYAGDAVQIQITCYQEKQFLVISVRDNGIGIKPVDLPLVFDRFYRAAADGHAVKGHGLGLNYVKSIMERQGGWVKMNSAKGEGTTVKLAWPV